MSEDDRVGYSGPEDVWKPTPSFYTDYDVTDTFVEDSVYADHSLLSINLENLDRHLSATIAMAEEGLKKQNLEIRSDLMLSGAQKAEWPSELGDPKEYVSYMQYRAMDKKNSRGSNYIRKKYQEAARGCKGGTLVDVAYVANLIKGEVKKIKAFIINYTLEGSNEPNQQRVIELFQDWTYYALENAGQLRYIIATEGKVKTKYSSTELERLSSGEAKNYQAVFQVHLNQANTLLDRLEKELKTHLTTNSDMFYDEFLGPAVKFRRQISSNMPIPAKKAAGLHDDVYRASGILDLNAKSLLSDLMKRNQIYKEKMGQLIARIIEADHARTSILGLTSKGVSPSDPFGKRHEDTTSEDAFFQTYEAWLVDGVSGATPSYDDPTHSSYFENRFDSAHNVLPGREKDDAHPQYLLKSGGHITGPIYLDEGATIDGVSVAAHSHTGTDGSSMIDGTSIIPGTIKAESVDTADTPNSAYNLILDHTISYLSPTGEASYEAIVSWDSLNVEGQFEVQIARVV